MMIVGNLLGGECSQPSNLKATSHTPAIGVSSSKGYVTRRRPPGIVAMDDADLFIQSLEDLNYLLASAKEYDVLRASHLIRQLLLDGANSLVDRVNRTHRLRIEYPVAPTQLPADLAATWFAGNELTALAPSTTQLSAVKWDKLQKMVVARCNGREYTIHDLIDYSAHVAGGVHKTDPRQDHHAVLARLQAGWTEAGLSPVAETVRAVGRVILQGLYELKDEVLGVALFEGGPGLSFYVNLVLTPMEGGEENYIIDIGSDIGVNRVTIFLDAHGDLCVRVYNSTGGTPRVLRAGPSDGAYCYGEPISLACEIGCRTDAVLVNVDAVGWSLTRVFRGSDAPAFTADHCHLVVGTDVTGRCRGRLHMMEYFMVRKVPNRIDQLNSRAYLARKLGEKYQWAVEFRPGSCMHTFGHPNFPANPHNPREGGLMAPSDERRPILRQSPFTR
jgi:hypothetical protein